MKLLKRFRIPKTAVIFIVVFLVCTSFLGQSFTAFADEKTVKYTKLSDFTAATIGSQTGTVFDKTISKVIPDVKNNYYDDIGGQLMALRSKSVDAIGLDEPVARLAAAENSDFAVFPEIVQTDNYGLPMPKNSPLTNEVSAIIEKYSADGTISKLKDKWFSGDISKMQINWADYENYDTPNGTLRYTHDSTQAPMSYVNDDGTSAGYEVELVLMIGKELGKKVEITKANFSSLIASVSTGKADIASGCISITDERRESVDFPASHYTGGIVLLCRKADVVLPESSSAVQKNSFLTSVKDSFYKNFIRENRWKLVVSGLVVTIKISLFSAVFGTIFGFCLCMARRSKSRLLSAISAVFIRIIQGIPMVVLLMVLFYVVFIKAHFAGETVAVIGFAINFGVYVSEMMRTGINSVDNGQWEAAETLGFKKADIFTKIIAPQALRYILPVYKGELISMVKMTSVVGYIAIQDLTKVSDIIRSRTYNAFFPLIATAVIYFLLSWAMISLLGIAEVRIDPKKRKANLNGIDTSKNTEITAFNNAVKKGSDEVIRIEHLKKEYPNVTPLSDVNASIRRGDVVTIIGPSGTGKSTLLRCINYLEKPTDGKIFVLGKELGAKETDLLKLRQKTGMVFQNFLLFPHLTVIENIMLAPVSIKNQPKQAAYENAMRLLGTVGLSQKALSYPDELSGGQKQRVAITRALAMEPEIILFDEPTSALDPTMVSEVLSVIRSLAKQGLTMMIVTHEMRFAKDVSTRIFYMDEGIIYEDGSPEQIFDSPKREKTRQFVNRLKVFHYDILTKDFDFIALGAMLETFGKKHSMPFRKINAIQTVVEELCVQTVLPKLSGDFHIGITIEYSDDTLDAGLIINYNGVKIDYLCTADEISATLINHVASKIEYSYENENIYKISIKHEV